MLGIVGVCNPPHQRFNYDDIVGICRESEDAGGKCSYYRQQPDESG